MGSEKHRYFVVDEVFAAWCKPAVEADSMEEAARIVAERIVEEVGDPTHAPTRFQLKSVDGWNDIHQILAYHDGQGVAWFDITDGVKVTRSYSVIE